MVFLSNRHSKISTGVSENNGSGSLFVKDKLRTSQTSWKYFKSQIYYLLSDSETQKAKAVIS